MDTTRRAARDLWSREISHSRESATSHDAAHGARDWLQPVPQPNGSSWDQPIGVDELLRVPEGIKDGPVPRNRPHPPEIFLKTTLHHAKPMSNLHGESCVQE
ncbi:uncharacterized protein LOC144718922 [Lampetra planeri]